MTSYFTNMFIMEQYGNESVRRTFGHWFGAMDFRKQDNWSQGIYNDFYESFYIRLFEASDEVFAEIQSPFINNSHNVSISIEGKLGIKIKGTESKYGYSYELTFVHNDLLVDPNQNEYGDPIVYRVITKMFDNGMVKYEGIGLLVKAEEMHLTKSEVQLRLLNLSNINILDPNQINGNNSETGKNTSKELKGHQKLGQSLWTTFMILGCLAAGILGFMLVCKFFIFIFGGAIALMGFYVGKYILRYFRKRRHSVV
ncbi:hypothetical protein [Fusibacter ferrireducens]|nr:hypothetical protein [Fusibacter ferrireducens]